MIPPHLSALPCGDCRKPTVTKTLHRVGNRFLCQRCHEYALATAAVQRPARKSFLQEQLYLGRAFAKVRRVVSLSYLAASVTGFIILPTCFDPADLRQRELSNTHASLESLKASWDQVAI